MHWLTAGSEPANANSAHRFSGLVAAFLSAKSSASLICWFLGCRESALPSMGQASL